MANQKAVNIAPVDPFKLIPTRIIVVPQGLKVESVGDADEVERARKAIEMLRQKDRKAYVMLWQLYLRIRISTDWDETYSLAGRYFVRYRFAQVYDGSVMRRVFNRVTPVVGVALMQIAFDKGVPEEALLWDNLPWMFRMKVRCWQLSAFLKKIAPRPVTRKNGK